MTKRYSAFLGLNWEEGAFTRCSNATNTLLEALRDVGYTDGKIEAQLLDHFRELYEAVPDSEATIGTNLRWIADTLHSLSPKRYPPPDTMTVGGNRVANAAAYLIDQQLGRKTQFRRQSDLNHECQFGFESRIATSPASSTRSSK